MLPSLSLYNRCSQIVPEDLLINPQNLMNPPPGAKPGGPSTSKPRLSAEPTFETNLLSLLMKYVILCGRHRT